MRNPSRPLAPPRRLRAAMARIPEPELMDDPAKAQAYAATDVSSSDRAMVADLLGRYGGELGGAVLDLGCGPGNISILPAEALAESDPAATIRTPLRSARLAWRG
ncbi:MAG: hypothetical protein ACKOZW_00045 [Cyanobium sp.]